MLRSGRIKYGNGDYDSAIEDLQDALVLDCTNEDVLEWLRRARRRGSLRDIEDKERELLTSTEIATKEKEVQEKAAMLEVEKAYLPPDKPEKAPIEIEELISPEEQRAEKTGGTD